MVSAPASKFAYVPVGLVDLGPNVRTDPTGIDQLARSVADHGVLEPVLCCPSAKSKDRLELLVGQRRFLAAVQAGLDRIPALLRPRPSRRDRLILQMVENFDRQPMSPMEEAFAFEALRDEGLTQGQMAQLTSRGVGYIRERLGMLTMPGAIQAAVHAGWISVKTAHEIPDAILDDPAQVTAIEQTLRLGDDAVRRWVMHQAAAGNGRSGGLTMWQGFNARLTTTTIVRIKEAAEHERIGLHEWVEQVLAAAADQVLDGTEVA